jgi:hypothetical protein
MKHIHAFESFLNESFHKPDGTPIGVDKNHQPITEAQKSWTRDEVIALLHKYRKMAHAVGSQNPFLSISAMENFIKSNL